MINVKEATAAALIELKILYPNKEILAPELEEVELTGDEKKWLITLGFLVPDPTPLPPMQRAVLQMSGNDKKFLRKYKIFTVDSDSGKVTSMKIRKL